MTRQFIAHRPKPRARASETPEPGAAEKTARPKSPPSEKPKEVGGPEGPEPTRYGDWERKGICVDF